MNAQRNPFPRRDREGAGTTGSHSEPEIPAGDHGDIGASPLPDGRVSDHGRTPTGPLAYLITFTTYGTWLHGDRRGSVDPAHNIPGTLLLDPDSQRSTLDRRQFKHPAVTLDDGCRKAVRLAISEVVRHRDWTLHAVNVRTNHGHVVVAADATPERVMNAMKSWATRRMVDAGVLPAKTKAWTRHGSTRYLWKPHQLTAACQYVCEGQGTDLETRGE